MTVGQKAGKRLAERIEGFSEFALAITGLRAIGPLSIYFTCEFITDTTRELSLCKQNESVLTSQL